MTSGSDLLLFLLPGDRLAKHRHSDKTMEKFPDPLERSSLGARGAAQNCTFKLNIRSGLRLKSKPVLSCVTGSNQAYDKQHLQTISCTCLSTLCWSMGGQPAGSQSSQLKQWAELLQLLSAGPPASLLLGQGLEGQASATHHMPRTPVAGSQSRLSSSGRKPSHKTQGDRAAAKRLPAPCLHSNPAPPPTCLARSPQFRGLILKAYFDSGYMAKLPKGRKKKTPSVLVRK